MGCSMKLRIVKFIGLTIYLYQSEFEMEHSADVVRLCLECFSFARMRCSRCKVTFYCSGTCQSRSWKSGGHKTICKPNHPQPPSYDAFVDDAKDTDLDMPVDWILVSPAKIKYASRSHFFQTAGTSLLSHKLLSEFHHSFTSSCKNIDIEQELSKEFQWESTIEREAIPGFKWPYDGTAIYAYYDANYKTSTSLAENIIGQFLLMLPGDVICRGNVIFGKFTVDPKTGNQVQVPFSRRELLSICEYNQQCGEVGSISDRVHFENILRGHQLKDMKSQNYQFFDDNMNI
jgi:hypothetical protein